MEVTSHAWLTSDVRMWRPLAPQQQQAAIKAATTGVVVTVTTTTEEVEVVAMAITTTVGAAITIKMAAITRTVAGEVAAASMTAETAAEAAGMVTTEGDQEATKVVVVVVDITKVTAIMETKRKMAATGKEDTAIITEAEAEVHVVDSMIRSQQELHQLEVRDTTEVVREVDITKEVNSGNMKNPMRDTRKMMKSESILIPNL